MRTSFTRAARLVDRLVIGVGVHPGKSPLFTPAEKIEMLTTECAEIARKTGCIIEPVTFDGLTVDAARHHKATIIFRGLRDGTDLDYEMQMSGMNGAMAADIETVFLPASPHVAPYRGQPRQADRADGRRRHQLRVARRQGAAEGQDGQVSADMRPGAPS